MKLTPKQQTILEAFNYQEPLDFLRHIPLRYEVLYEKNINEWTQGELVIFEGKLLGDIKTFRFGNQARSTMQVIYCDKAITVNLFNRPYLKSAHYQNSIVVTGHVQENGQVVARSITNKPLETQTGIIPIYPLKQKIKQYEIRRLMKKIFDNLEIEDIVPDTYIKRYKLMHRKTALRCIHQPESLKHVEMAQRTLKYEEFLLFHLSNALKSDISTTGIQKKINQDLLKKRIQTLPYALTAEQLIALEEINHDLASHKSMHRLLQGDVGSGKTIVSILSALSVIDNGFQAVFVVPTEILLNQHEITLRKLFPNVKYAVLNSSMENKEETIQAIKQGDVDFVIGTHALFQEGIEFNNLGFVIIDEQHRFGVSQRQSIIDKGENVDVLMLSATPIPRSLASSIYFDLDVSTIASYPSNRKETKTSYIQENSIQSILPHLIKRLDQKDQMYIVCPSIEESKRLKTRSVLDIYESLKEPFKDYAIAYLHGRMQSSEKESIMAAFASGAIDILVSTTIIEVGIDVPSANTMVIYNAEMFGLSTLHQLRGRVGRSDRQGECYVLSSQDNEDVKIRLNNFTQTTDGFKLSMLDLRTRGMGDLLGDRQSGLPTFVFADIENDEKILRQAKIDAQEITANLEDTDCKDIVKYTHDAQMVYN